MSKEITDTEFNTVRDFLNNSCSITLSDNKKYLVETRLGRLLDENNIPTYTDLIRRAQLGGNSGLQDRIIDAMTTNETLWFRDRKPFDAFKDFVLPSLVKNKTPGTKIRIWSSASSTGQEPYSIAILINEFCEANPGLLASRFEIIASDISFSAIQNAKEGMYNKIEMDRGMPENYLYKYFHQMDAGWRVKGQIKNMVRFRQFNLQKPFADQGILDVILCRNALIYFSIDFKKELMHKFAEALSQDGFFFLGVSESTLGITSEFGPVVYNGGVVYRKLRK